MKFGENALMSCDHSDWFTIWVLRQDAIQSPTTKKPVPASCIRNLPTQGMFGESNDFYSIFLNKNIFFQNLSYKCVLLG